MSGSPSAELATREIAGLTIHDIGFGRTVDLIIDWARARSAGYVCTPNADYVVLARRNIAFHHAIQNARLRVPDGMAIVYASRVAGRPLGATVTGRLLLPAVAVLAAREGLPLGLFGAGPGVAQRARERLLAIAPGLKITSAQSPPTPLEIGSAADFDAVAELRASDARIIFVALGAPRQELWMERHAGEFNGAVLVGVGAAFDIVAGRFREAPRWLTHIGFEWLFRLAQEPRRLARRYLVDDPWIFVWALRTRIGRGRQMPP